MGDEEAERRRRVEGGQDVGTVAHVVQAEGAHDEEPDQRDWAEERGDPRGAAALDPEEAAQDQHGDRQDVGAEMRRDEFQPLDRREDGDRRRDGGIAVEERGAGDAEGEDDPGAPPDRALGQGKQRERAAFAVVVGAEDEHHVLERDDEDERPDEQRDDADDLGLGQPVAPGRPERLAKRVERAGADVAVDDPDRAEDERPETGWVGLGGIGGGLHHRRTSWRLRSREI